MLEFTGAVFLAKLTVRDFSVEAIGDPFISNDGVSLLLGSGFVAFLLIWVCCLLLWIIDNYQENIVGIKKSRKTFIAVILLSTLFSFVGFLAFNSAKWVMETFSGVGIQEILYTISQPIEGTDTSQVFSFLVEPLNNAILFASVFALIVSCLIVVFYPSGVRLDKKRIYFGVVHSLPLVTSVAVLFSGIALGVGEFGYSEVKSYLFDTSTIYEEEYADPATTKLTFPEHKRNLIYIFVESLETTYLSKELGGDMDYNLLPNLSGMIEKGEAINFSNSELIGGGLTPPGTGFTVGAMVAQTAGIPLNVVGGLNENDYGATDNFLPGAYSIGQILEKQNYRQMLLIGSDGYFGGRDKYFEQHGDFEIRDLGYAQKNGWVPKNYRVGWGYEDEKLIDFAKESLTELSSGDDPFNLTMLTVNTHFPNGLMTAETENVYDVQYHNVIQHADELLYELLSWIKEQPFYADTTIVLSGDHLTMDATFSENVSEDYERTVFNMVINSPIAATSEKNRNFTTLDFFPTTLAALGVEIEGDRLGLGTNLFSSEETISEKKGFDYLTDELSMRSKFYQEDILKGSDISAKRESQSE